MFLLIDGYNLLKAIEGRLALSSRDQLIALLSRYLIKKKLEGAIVFDSGPWLMMTREQCGPLQIIYVGQGHTADEYIIDYCHQQRDKQFLLVTADRGILRAVQLKYVQPLKPLLFGELLTTFLTEKKREGDTPSSGLIKKNTAQKNEPEIDELMTYASTLNMTKKVDKEDERSRRHNRLSKKEKKHERILKKL